MNNKHQDSLRIFILLISLLTAVVVVLVANVVIGNNARLTAIEASLATAQEESQFRTAVDPFGILDDNCVACHTDRRFLEPHTGSLEALAVIKRMSDHPDAVITPAELDKIHASLVMLKCVQCHDEGNLMKFSGMNPAQQRVTLRNMMEMPGANITTEDARVILEGLHSIQGF